jgi:hypothetical protein
VPPGTVTGVAVAVAVVVAVTVAERVTVAVAVDAAAVEVAVAVRVAVAVPVLVEVAVVVAVLVGVSTAAIFGLAAWAAEAWPADSHPDIVIGTASSAANIRSRIRYLRIESILSSGHTDGATAQSERPSLRISRGTSLMASMGHLLIRREVWALALLLSSNRLSPLHLFEA